MSRYKDMIERALNRGHVEARYAAGGKIPTSGGADSVPALLSKGRKADDDGSTVRCECGQSFTHQSIAVRSNWFTYGHDHGFGTSDGE